MLSEIAMLEIHFQFEITFFFLLSNDFIRQKFSEYQRTENRIYDPFSNNIAWNFGEPKKKTTFNISKQG